MTALGKRTLAAAEALPKRPRPADLQALPRQIVDAIRLDARAAMDAPEVEQVIGKLTRSLAAAAAMAPQSEVVRDPNHDLATESGPQRTHRDPVDVDGARREPTDAESRSPAEELPTKVTDTPRDKAIEAIEAAIRRMMVAPQRGNARAAAAAAAVGESLSEVLAAVERTLATELAKQDGEETDGAGRRVDRPREGGAPGDAAYDRARERDDASQDDASIDEGSIEDAAEAAEKDRAADEPPAHDPRLRISTFGHGPVGSTATDPQLIARQAASGNPHGAHGAHGAAGFVIPTALGPIRFHHSEGIGNSAAVHAATGSGATSSGATSSGATSAGSLDAKLTQTGATGTSSVDLEGGRAQLAAEGAFGSLQWGPDGLRGFVPGLGQLDEAPFTGRMRADITRAASADGKYSSTADTTTGKAADGTAADAKMADGKTADAKMADGKTADAKASYAKASYARIADGKTSSARMADGKTADGKADDGKAQGNAADGGAADGTAADGKTPDEIKANEAKPANAKADEDKDNAKDQASKKADGKDDHGKDDPDKADKKVDDKAGDKKAGDKKLADAPEKKDGGKANLLDAKQVEPAKKKHDDDFVKKPVDHGPAHAPHRAAPPVANSAAAAHIPARPAQAHAQANQAKRDPAPAAHAPPKPGAAPRSIPPPRSGPRTITAPPVPSQPIAQPLAKGGDIVQPSFQISGQGRTPPTPQVPAELANPGAAAAAKGAGAAKAPAASTHTQPGARPGTKQVAPTSGKSPAPPTTARPTVQTPHPAPAPAAPAAPASKHRPAAAAPAAGAQGAHGAKPATTGGPAAAPARLIGSHTDGVKTPTATPARSAPQPLPPAPATPAGTTAAPRVPTTPAPAPSIPPVQAAPANSTPKPAGMVPSTVSLDGDRNAARAGIAAESATQREVPQQAATATKSQVTPLGPVLDSQVPTVEAPARRATVASATQGAATTNQQGHARSTQTTAQGNQQIAGQARGAAQERAQYASAPPPGVIAASSPAAMAHVTQGERSELAAITGPSHPPAAGAGAIAGAATAATARIAAQAHAMPPDTKRAVQPHTLAPVDTGGAATATATVSAHFAQARTMLDQPPEAPQLHLPASAPVEPSGPQGGVDPQGARGPQAQGAGGAAGPGAAMPNRGAAIASIESGVATQMQGQAPAQLAAGHAQLTGQLKGHIDQAEQHSNQSVTDAQTTAATGTQAAQTTLASTTTAAQTTAQTDAAQCRAQGQVQAAAAQQTMTTQVAAAQTAAQTETLGARATRDAGVAQSRTAFEADQAAANAVYTADHATAQTSFNAQNQAAQTELATNQQQAQQEATTATQAAHTKNEADISRESAANDQRRNQAQADHDQQVNQTNQQAQTDQQNIQSNMDQQVQATDNKMRTDVSGEEQRGQQAVNQHLADGERNYHAEIQSGQQKADAEQQRADAAAAQKRAEADAQKDKGGGGGIFGKVINWVKDRVNDLLDLAKSILEAARKAVMAIMEAARNAAMAVLNAARNLAMAALNAAKQAIQGLISAAAAAIRGLISAAANLIRSVIQTLATALQTLVRVLTTALNALVQAFQTFVNMALDVLVAAVSLINKDLGRKLDQATQGFRQAFNRACDNLQQNITAAGQRLEQGIQAAADKAKAAVTSVENQLNAAVTAIENKAHAAVDQAFAVAEAVVNQVFDAVEAGVNKAFDAAEAVVNEAFDLAQSAVEGYRQAFNAACDKAVELADKALTALGDLAGKLVDMLPDSLIEGFIDFWNGPWRSMIIIGLATIAAVAITVATGGVGGPIAGMLLAGVIGGTLTGGAYLAGELVARQGAIDLAENGKGIYVPNYGYVPVGADGKPDLSGVPKDKQEEVAGQLGPGGWAGSNFETNPDGTFQMGPDGKPTGRPSNEIANEAVMEGIQGFGEGFISAALAAGGGAIGEQIGGMVAKKFAGEIAKKVVTRVVSGAVEGAFDVVSNGATTFWNTGFDALQAGKSPSDAFKAAAGESLKAVSDPGAIATSLANIGVGGARAKGLDNLLDKRLTNGLVRKGADIVIDTTVETVSEAAGNFGYTLATTGDINKAKEAGAASFDPTKIFMSAGMSTVGDVVNTRAEKYAENHGGGSHDGGGTHDGDSSHDTGDSHDSSSSNTNSSNTNSSSDGGSTRSTGDGGSSTRSTSDGGSSTRSTGNTRTNSDGGSTTTHTTGDSGSTTTHTNSDGGSATTHTTGDGGSTTTHTTGDGGSSTTHTNSDGGSTAHQATGDGGSTKTHTTGDGGSTSTHTTGDGGPTSTHTTGDSGSSTTHATGDRGSTSTHTTDDGGSTTAPPGRRRTDDDVDLPRTDTTNGDTAHGDHTHDAGGTAAEVGAFRGDSRPSDQADLTHSDLQRQIDDRATTLMPDGVRRDGDGFALPDGTPVNVRVGDSRDGSVASYERNADGSYEVTVSRRASDEDIARAVAHEVAEIHNREQGVADGPPALANDGPLPDGATLSAHDHGRLAELRVLADDLSSTGDLRSRHELQSLLDSLGIRNGRPDADARLDLIRPHLDPDTLAAVERMRDPQPLRLTRDDVDDMARILDADPRFTGDPKALEDKLRLARDGNEGALGELEAVQRWLAEGRSVEMLPTADHRMPDFRVDGRAIEIKTSSTDIGDRGVRRDIEDVNDQFKKSGLGEQGTAELQLHGDAATAPLADIESQVRRQFNQNRSRALDEVSVYRDGVLAAQWVRNPDGTVSRRFPPPDPDAGARPAGPTSPTSGPEGGTPPPGTGASSAVPNSSYHNQPTSPNHDAVQSSVDAALPRLDLHTDPRGGSSVQRNPDGTLSITVDGRTRTAEVSVVPAGSMNNPTDVANFDVSRDPIRIVVADGVDPHHVERALAHEVAEVSSIMRHDSPDLDGGTGARPDGLDHDDIGRIAELRVLLIDPDPRRAGEIDALLAHMGVLGDDPATVARRQAIEDELGHPLPLTPEQRRTFDDANRIYNQIAGDRYQGPEAARAAWASRLSQDGMDVAARRDRSRDDFTAQGANPDAARGTPSRRELPESAVLPGQPADPRPYTPADRDAATRLRDSMRRIEEYDRTLSQRDQQGDQGRSADTGRGDSDRRTREVENVRKLLEELQLGGTDASYLDGRLSELEQLFPDLALRQGVTDRADNRRRAEEAHARADEARTRNQQRQEDLIARVHDADPPAVDRLVIGSGIAGLTNASTLPGNLDFPGTLMLGTADPIGQRNPAARWGQRTGAYDPHPLFGDDGPGSTRHIVEDPGEYIHIGELNDAMDIARDQMGIAPYPGSAGTIETRATADPGSWPDNGYTYRVPVTGPDGTTRYVYANNIDITSGPGGTRMPNPGVLSPEHLDVLRDRGDLIGGNDLLNEHRDGGTPEGRVLVYSFGLTGAWAARHSTTEVGASHVDWAGSSGTRHDNEERLGVTRGTDRTQDAFGDPDISPTTDPVVRMRPGDPRGVVVTFHGPDGTYDVHYNRVAIAMGFDAGSPSGAHGDQQSSRQLLGDMPMGLDPDGTPTLQNDDGSVRVFGAAATSGPNLSRDDLDTLRDRQAREIGQLTGDSPTADTVEFGGRTITEANRALALQGVSDPARAQLSALPWPEFTRLRGMSSADLDRIGNLPPAELRDFVDGLAPHRRDEGNHGTTDDGSDGGDIDPTSGPSPTGGPTPTGPAPAGATHDGDHDAATHGAGEPDRGGTAANVGDFRGDARRGPDLTPAQVRGTIDDNLRLIRPDGARYDAATQSFRLAGGERVEVRVGPSRNGSVASFEFDPTTGHYVVTVSSRARDQDVVRALSHELAEIDAGRRDDIVLDNRDDRPDTLTTHLVGRYAEIRVLVDQMFQSRLTAQSDQVRRTEGDLRQLVDALGFNGPDRDNRLRLLEQHDPDLLDRLRVIAPGIVPGSPPQRPDTSAPSYRPDRLDKKVSKLSPDQQAYYDAILASSPDPNDPKARKKAYKAAKSSRPLSEADIQVVRAARERLASMQLTPIDDGTNPNLVQMEVSFDGTWNSRDDMLFDTNPALLEQMFQGTRNYQVGVGTTPLTAPLGGLAGAGIHNRIDRAYDNLVRQINDARRANPNAEIVLITSGFSRGATAARAFVNELNRRGVPDLTSPRDRRGNHTRYHEPPRIGAMVLFDTVGSVGIPGTNLNPGLDLSIPANAENVLHLTAADEHRGPFPLSSVVDRSRPDDERIAEVALPGVHSDVGGSYPNPYSRIPLQLAQEYLARLGVHIDPVNPDDLVDPADPSLRLHRNMGNPDHQRGEYPSHNPAPPRRQSDDDADE